MRWSVVCVLISVQFAAPVLAADDVPPPPPPPPVADTPPSPQAAQADALSEQAKELYKQQKYAEAFGMFQRAHALDARASFLYNMAKCKEKLAEYAEAVKLLEAYLVLYRQQNSGAQPANAADVEALIRELKRRAFEALPEVTVQSTPPGALVSEEGAALGSTPLVTHLQPGRHKLLLKLEKHADLETELLVPQTGKVSVVLAMKSLVKRAQIGFWCNVRGAQVILDGKVVAVTPFAGNIDVEPGRHQVAINRANYKPFESEVTVPEERAARVHVVLERTEKASSWRAPLGWPLLILGALGIGGGVAASKFADAEWRGTPAFNDYEQLQNAGYYGGGALAGIGLTLLVWDAVRDAIPADERVDGPSFEAGVDLQPLGKTP
ncbi:MAG: PEGA domain-containing protein [Deltaproteobacteria bacterium]|nr:PEGA domain-containing protein [Deltaproteobacteria bacterium]